MTEEEFTKALLKAEHYHQEGERAAQEEDFERAEYLLKQSIELYPNEDKIDAELSLAVTYTLWGKNKKSIKLLESLVDDDSLRKYYWLGTNYNTINEFEKAIKCFRKCIDIDGKFLDSYDALSFSLKNIGNLTEANKILDKLYSINPKYFEEKDDLIDYKNDATYQIHTSSGDYIGEYMDGKKHGLGSINFGGTGAF